MLNYALRFWFGLVTFGLGLHIPEHEVQLCRELMANAWIAVGLQNDLWSWPKERDAAKQHGKDHVVNAIWVLMQEHRTDVDGATQICRELVVEYVAKYLKVIEATKNDESISLDLRKYIDAMLYSISGNVVWSLECPRYNPEVSFNKTQLEWMRQGLPASEASPALAPSAGIILKEFAASTIADESDSMEYGSGSGSTQDSSASTGLSLSPVHSQENDKNFQQVDTDHTFFEVGSSCPSSVLGV